MQILNLNLKRTLIVSKKRITKEYKNKKNKEAVGISRPLFSEYGAIKINASKQPLTPHDCFIGNKYSY